MVSTQLFDKKMGLGFHITTVSNLRWSLKACIRYSLRDYSGLYQFAEVTIIRNLIPKTLSSWIFQRIF